jgi:DNA-binding XRE family transcriptional regulator
VDADGCGESFAGLLLRYRARTRLTQSQLAKQVGVHLRSVQCWEAGINCPGVERLRDLIAAFLRSDGLRVGHEELEAEALWDAALRKGPRLSVPFDAAWFRALSHGHAVGHAVGSSADAVFGAASGVTRPRPVSQAGVAGHREDWADAPDVSWSVGRDQELTTLRHWIVEQRCQVVELTGMGGIGKTTLATRLAREVATDFEVVYWRSLRFAPSLADWLAGALTFIEETGEQVPDREGERIALLIRLLRQRRCLLVLDNLETLLEPGDCQGRFLDSFDGYRRLVQSLAESPHQSCLVLTSREASADLGFLTLDAVRSLELRGLSVEESQALLGDKQLTGTDLDWVDFVTRCGGNGLVLRLTGETVRQVFGGEIGAFLLAVGSNGAIHGGVRRLLASQLDERLSPVEQSVVQVLAATDEPVTPGALLAELGPRIGRGAVIEALEALRRRSLIERSDSGNGLTLHPVVRDYVGMQPLVQSAA